MPQKNEDELKKEITQIHKRMALEILKNKGILTNTKNVLDRNVK